MKKLLSIVLASAVIAGGFLATSAPSQAQGILPPGWTLTNHGYVYCNYSYGYADCR